MKRFNVKGISAVYAAVALIVGLILIRHGSTYQAAFNPTNLGVTEVRGIYALGLLQLLLGAGALITAALSYRFSRQQY
jgi:hypothetical protein